MPKMTIQYIFIILLINIVNAKLSERINFFHNNDGTTWLDVKDFDENDRFNFLNTSIIFREYNTPDTISSTVIFNGTTEYMDSRFLIYEDNENPKHLLYFTVMHVTSYIAGYYRLQTVVLQSLDGALQAINKSYELDVTVVMGVYLLKENENQENITCKGYIYYMGEYNPKGYLNYNYENVSGSVCGNITSAAGNLTSATHAACGSVEAGNITSAAGAGTPIITNTVLEMPGLPAIMFININKNGFKGTITMRFTYYKSLRGLYYSEPNMRKAKALSLNVV